jgi:hypothetical protein
LLRTPPSREGEPLTFQIVERCAGRSRPAPGVGERADNQRLYAAGKRPPRPSRFLSLSCSLPPLTHMWVSPGRKGEGSLPAAPGACGPFFGSSAFSSAYHTAPPSNRLSRHILPAAPVRYSTVLLDVAPLGLMCGTPEPRRRPPGPPIIISLKGDMKHGRCDVAYLR